MMENNPGYYETISNMEVDYPTQDLRQIQKDAIRTYDDVQNE